MKEYRTLFLLVSLLTAATACAAPTVGGTAPGYVTVYDSAVTSAAHRPAKAGPIVLWDSDETHFTVSLLGTASNHGILAESVSLPKNLPAVPGALLMAVMGFACVTAVKDRKAWLALAAGLLWVSQSGLYALPRCISHIHSNKVVTETGSRHVTGIHGSQYWGRTESDILGTAYVGLLRHLAGIPHEEGTPLLSLPFALSAVRTPREIHDSPCLTSAQTRDSATRPAILVGALPSLNHMFGWLTCAAQQLVAVVAALGPDSLLRGPPKLCPGLGVRRPAV